MGDEQVKELLAYHRIQRRSQDVCPYCIKESRDREKKCFVCSRTYTEDGGVMREKGDKQRGQLDSNSQAIANMLRDKHQPKLKDASEEEKEARRKKWLAEMKAKGIKITEV